VCRTVAKLSVVGIGPGSPDYVTPAARRAVQAADIVMGAERSLKLLETDIRGEVIVLTAKNVTEMLNRAVKFVEKGKTVALLSTGDPGFSGLLGSILKYAQGRNVEVSVIPGVSSIQACAARLCMCWDEMSLFTFHKGTTVGKMSQLLEALREGNDVMLLPEPKAFRPREIASFLLKSGLDKETPVFVCERLTLSGERVVESTLEQAATLDFDALCVMVIKVNRKGD
jgi:cobalt-precorrin-7 (C5)-methyltransferase